jgi:hypothetical protein
VDFITKINKVVAELKQNPQIHVAHFQILPAQAESIAKVETALGYALDSSITDFYKACGGVQLLWVHEDNEQFYRVKAAPVSDTPLDDWYIKGEHINFNPDGAIWIPNIDTVFLHDWTQEGLEASADEFEDAVTLNYEGFKIQVLDWFAAFYDVAFLINGTSNPPLVLGEDNQACYTDSKTTTFEKYLKLIIKTKGDISNRVDAFKE